MAPRKCEVCDEAQSKYKCPNCLIPYCSLACFKRHKEIPCAKPEIPCTKPESSKEEGKIYPGSARNDDKPSTLTIVSGPGSARNGSARNDDNKPFYVDEQSEVLLESQLQSIASSDEIRDSIKEEKLQKLIYNIDSSADAERELDKAMEDESFRLFTEKILSTISS